MAVRVEGNIASERAILSCLAKYGKDALIDIDDIVDVDCFSNDTNQNIYKCLEHSLQDSSNVDIPSFLASASQLGLYEVISDKKNMQLIKTIFEMPVLKESARKFAAQVKKLKIAKEIQLQIEDIHKNISQFDGSESISEILNAVENPIFNMTNTLSKNTDNKPVKMFGEITEHVQHLRDNKCELVGIPTGLSLYDLSIGGGHRKGSVNLVASRPKTGKTTFPAWRYASQAGLDEE